MVIDGTFHRVVLEIAVINYRRDFAVWLCDKKHFGNSEGKVDLKHLWENTFPVFYTDHSNSLRLALRHGH